MGLDSKNEVNAPSFSKRAIRLNNESDDNGLSLSQGVLMLDVLVSSVNVPSSASMGAQVPARRNRVAGDAYAVPAGSDQDTLSLKNQSKFKPLAATKAEKKPVETASIQFTAEASFDEVQKRQALEKKQSQVQALNHEVITDAYKASAYASHGNKGSYIDFST